MIDSETYLLKIGEKLGIGDPEKIDKSIDYLKQKIWGVFQNKLLDVNIFGSYDRGTMLSPTIDKEADVDLLVIFKAGEFKPQTYLQQLRTFSEKNYPRSDIYPDFPTIVIELNHITFELVPSFWSESTFGKQLKIPGSPSKDLTWITTDPSGFKNRVQKKDKTHTGMIIPLIKILKYWNMLNGKPFSSYYLERFIVERTYSGKTIQELFYQTIKELSAQTLNVNQTQKMKELTERKRRLTLLENGKLLEYIEQEFTAFMPNP